MMLTWLGFVILLAACGDAPTQTSAQITDDAGFHMNVSSTAPREVAAQPGIDNQDATNDNRVETTGQEIVATVNGVAITQQMFEREYARKIARTNAADPQALRRQVLDTLIEQELIEQAATAMGIIITDDDVRAELNTLRELADTPEAWQQYLAMNGYTEDEMFEAQRQSLLTQQVRDRLMEPYQGQVEQVNARHIVVRTQETANTILEQLRAGEGFATLAAQYSIDSTTRSTGGNLGWFTRNELFYPALAEVAFRLEAGQIAGPISTSLGYHILQTLEKDTRLIEEHRRPVLWQNVFVSWLDEQYRNAEIIRSL